MRYIKPAVLSITNAMSMIKSIGKNSPLFEGEQPSPSASYEADE
jgi:hypothetical protein